MIASELLPSLRISADLLRRPLLPADQLEDGRMVCLQEIASTADDLAQQAMNEMRARFYGSPDGRNTDGTIESINRITLEDLREAHQSLYRPNGMIIGVAGKFDWERVVDEVGQLFGDWKSKPDPDVVISPPVSGPHHISFESEQTHIIVGFKGFTTSHPDFYLNRCAIGVLSDGMSSRLFTEVREKRGLCYTVYASNHMTKDQAGVFCYSGTSTARAQQTLDVIVEQLVELGNGITKSELDRLKIQIRSGLISQQESCRSRASSINSDWFHLGRLRTLDELNDQISSITVEQVNDFLVRHPPSNFSLVTLGSNPLELKEHGIPTTPIG
jgi:predicted Zn-dependent peptidase